MTVSYCAFDRWSDIRVIDSQLLCFVAGGSKWDEKIQDNFTKWLCKSTRTADNFGSITAIMKIFFWKKKEKSINWFFFICIVKFLSSNRRIFSLHEIIVKIFKETTKQIGKLDKNMSQWIKLRKEFRILKSGMSTPTPTKKTTQSFKLLVMSQTGEDMVVFKRWSIRVRRRLTKTIQV